MTTRIWFVSAIGIDSPTGTFNLTIKHTRGSYCSSSETAMGGHVSAKLMVVKKNTE